MTALNQLATRLRLNAASMEHGEAERDIRAAADILDSFADAGEIEESNSRYSPFRDMQSKCLVSPRYKACGNGWATNQPRWILTRLLAIGEHIDPFTGEEDTPCS